ncbi:BRO family protein [Flavobacterium johnsoniae]|uniref:DNA-damage-inducible protein D n=1 Tax=Flavobacterium johnsoniae TaxID=986 RepID=A0A1M5UR73_FLAJO|nr:BRO family protein [Flavobacterium johnsoniae]SHH65537.1 DNA-damage-inducible protein D [Flavobacterium johnsoniae]
MRTEEIKHFFDEFEAEATEIEGVECWSARRLQKLFGYNNWDSFKRVIKKAEDACKNAGESVENHFPALQKRTGKKNTGTEKLVDDIALTRYACYLIAQNGDSKKEEIAFAQNYFAVQTRRAELVEQKLRIDKIREEERLAKKK